jgi:hypothetical protein
MKRVGDIAAIRTGPAGKFRPRKSVGEPEFPSLVCSKPLNNCAESVIDAKIFAKIVMQSGN